MKKFVFAFFCITAVFFTVWFKAPEKVALQNFTQVEVAPRAPASEPAGSSCFDLVKTIFNKLVVENDKMAEVKNILKNYNVADAKISGVKTYSEALDAVFEKVVGNGATSVNKSEIIVKFGKELRALYANAGLKSKQVKDLDYALGRSVLKAEEYTGKEFRKLTDADFALGRNSRLYHIDYKHYKEYSKAFLNGTAPYSTLDQTGGTIISRTDIREMEAHNLFPVYIGHDMKHVVYALNHERYFPMLFGAARSKNHMRYVLMGALSEGADTVQYSEERAICQHFKEVKGLDLEEGMLWIGRASKAELDELAEELGHKSTFDGLAAVFNTWSPPSSTKYSPAGLDEQLDAMFVTVRKEQSEPDWIERYNTRINDPLYR